MIRLLLLLSASPYSGSPQRESILHLTRSISSPALAPTLFKSSLAKSIHLLLGLPLFLRRDRDWTKKIKGKEYADKRRRATTSDFEIGDEVLLKQNKANKLSSHFHSEPCKVVEKGKGQVTVRNKQWVDIIRSMGVRKKIF